MLIIVKIMVKSEAALHYIRFVNLKKRFDNVKSENELIKVPYVVKCVFHSILPAIQLTVDTDSQLSNKKNSKAHALRTQLCLLQPSGQRHWNYAVGLYLTLSCLNFYIFHQTPWFECLFFYSIL